MYSYTRTIILISDSSLDVIIVLQFVLFSIGFSAFSAEGEVRFFAYPATPGNLESKITMLVVLLLALSKYFCSVVNWVHR